MKINGDLILKQSLTGSETDYAPSVKVVKDAIDDLETRKLSKTGGSMSGNLTMGSNTSCSVGRVFSEAGGLYYNDVIRAGATFTHKFLVNANLMGFLFIRVSASMLEYAKLYASCSTNGYSYKFNELAFQSYNPNNRQFTVSMAPDGANMKLTIVNNSEVDLGFNMRALKIY